MVSEKRIFCLSSLTHFVNKIVGSKQREREKEEARITIYQPDNADMCSSFTCFLLTKIVTIVCTDAMPLP